MGWEGSVRFLYTFNEGINKSDIDELAAAIKEAIEKGEVRPWKNIYY